MEASFPLVYSNSDMGYVSFMLSANLSGNMVLSDVFSQLSTHLVSFSQLGSFGLSVATY